MKKNKLSLLLLTLITSSFILTGCDNSISQDGANVSASTKSSQPTLYKPATPIIGNASDAKKFLMDKYHLPETAEVIYMSDVHLYQAYVQGQVIYLSQDGKYLIPAHLINALDNSDVTQAYIDSKSVIDVSKLPLDLAIKQVKGNGEHKIYVFTDPDCPYCHMFEMKYVSTFKNVTVYNFLFPLTSIHPQAQSDSLKILCSKDKVGVYSSWMNTPPQMVDKVRANLPKVDNCPAGVAALTSLTNLATSLGISGTPTVYNESGFVVRLTDPEDFATKIGDTPPTMVSDTADSLQAPVKVNTSAGK